MAYNDKKIIKVLLEELKKVPERCPGYKKEFAHLLGEVLQAERGHRITRTTVVKQITDKVNTVGMFLYHSHHKTQTNKRKNS